ncbi:MAG: hypothetical protein O2877_01665 [bacterium]|nr:hypothetical protein [bacterium]
MTRFSTIIFSLLIIGAGCNSTVQKNVNRNMEWSQFRGMALFDNAIVQSGSPILVNRPSINRRFRSAIAPTFTDKNGNYTMDDGASIEVQIGVQGTPEKDRSAFKTLETLSEFEDGEINGWMTTIAYDSSASRWVLRAVQADPGFREEGYHVIECLSKTNSNFVFWDGCRTFIERAQLIADEI